jgi:hypothetical protein
MATLKVVFKAIDEISSKFNEMTQSGERALEAFENTGTAADGALSKVSPHGRADRKEYRRCC